jgi:hypothetical protein
MQLQSIQNKIYEMRGYKVMLDFDLVELYEVETMSSQIVITFYEAGCVGHGKSYHQAQGDHGKSRIFFGWF